MLPTLLPFLNESQRRAFAEVEAKGEAGGMAKAVLKILAKRGISTAEGERQRILDCTDLATLDHWLDRALTIETVDALFE